MLNPLTSNEECTATIDAAARWTMSGPNMFFSSSAKAVEDVARDLFDLLVAAGEAGSILRAAENIYVSQPSISNAIAHLEDVFGVQLFIRHHARGMSLTTAGGQIMEQVQVDLK